MPRFSRLATLSQIGLFAYLTLVVAWTAAAWQFSFSQVALRVAILIAAPAVVVASAVLVNYLFSHRWLAHPSLIDVFTTWSTEMLAVVRAGLWWQPFRWRQFPNGSTRHLLPTSQPIQTVVFIHGFVSNRGLWNPWMRRLRHDSKGFVSVNLEPLFGSIDAYLPQIAAAVTLAESISISKPIVICHSMGGLALRKWLVSHPDARQRVGRIVTIATPHFGTWLGKLSPASNAREMRLGSQWLKELEHQEYQLRPTETYSGFVCWYSNCDNLIIPASSALLPGADNRKVSGNGHLALVYHPAVMDLEQYFKDSPPQ